MNGIPEELREALADRYHVEEEVGAGGMATVYRAHDLRHDRSVAIKVLRPELTSGVGPERFEREIQIAARLTHPHILGLIDSGAVGDRLFYVMPFVDGESLRERLDREGKLTATDARRVLREVTDALAYAHEQGVVHRDIKPANVMLSGRHASVTDFGVARAVQDATAQVTAAGTAIGTPKYMAPEQATAEGVVDHRADVYAIGVLGYELLTGRSPFRGTSFESILAEKLSGDLEPFDVDLDAVPQHLADALHKCLARDPHDRWQSAGELLSVLEELETPAEGTPMVARRAFPGTARRAGLGAAAVVVLVLGGLSGSRVLERRAAVAEARERIPSVVEVAGRGDVAGAFAIAHELRVVLGDDPELAEAFDAISMAVEFRTEPSGARVSWRPYGGGENSWVPLGQTPLQTRIASTYADIRFELEGYQPRVWSDIYWSFLFIEEPVPLLPAGSVPEGTVPVAGGRVSLESPGLEGIEPVRLADYFLDRTEVTNADYKAFVDAGGYQDAQWWTEAFVGGGETLDFSVAVARFTDLTGRPGPSTWSAGDYPAGTADHPVTGVSWFEAMAYARFVDKELPTIFHWNRGLSASGTNFIAPRSIFGATSAQPVGSSGAYGRFGNYDMGGNAREWAYNEFNGRRYIMGGGWDDARFMFNDSFTQDPWDRLQTNGFRLAVYTDSTGLGEARRIIERPFRDFTTEVPVSDDVFEAFRSFHAYDQTPLNAEVVDVVGGRDWIRERVTYDAGYEGPQGMLYVFLPRNVEPPYQTVVFFPGSGAIFTNSMDDDFGRTWDFAVKTGRAVLFPVYWSTYERSDGLTTDQPDASAEYRERVRKWAIDFRRGIDYAVTRDDLNTDDLGFLGFSWGGRLGPLMIALEPRIDAGVLYVAGLKFQAQMPEADPFHYAPRVTVPMLMLNGSLDHFFPLETSARPLFELLGTPDGLKRHVVEEGGHSVPQELLISETLGWFDRWLGAVRR